MKAAGPGRLRPGPALSPAVQPIKVRVPIDTLGIADDTDSAVEVGCSLRRTRFQIGGDVATDKFRTDRKSFPGRGGHYRSGRGNAKAAMSRCDRPSTGRVTRNDGVIARDWRTPG